MTTSLAHISGPLEPASWVAIAVGGLAFAWALIRSVRLTLHPGENEPDHIKRLAIEDPARIEVAAGADVGGRRTS